MELNHMTSILNTIYLELDDEDSDERRGHSKRIELVVGDLVEARADLIVASSSVDIFPSGAVINSLKRYHGIPLDKSGLHPIQLFPTPQFPKTNLGVWLSKGDLPTGQDLIVVAMTPRAKFKQGFQNPFDGLLGVLRKIDQGLPLLGDETITQPTPPYSIALPILGGDRSFEPQERMKAILHGLEDLIRQSRMLEVVSLYVYYKSEAQKWSDEFDRVLGRYHLIPPFKGQCGALKEALLNRMKKLRGIRYLDQPHLKHEVLVPLSTHLTYDPPCVATLATFGRKSWEAVTFYYMRFLDESEYKKKDGLTAIFNKLLDKFIARNMISSWVTLSITKELGNGAAHVQGELGIDALDVDDYPIILFTLEQVFGLVDPFAMHEQKNDQLFFCQWTEKIESEIDILLAKLPESLHLPSLHTEIERKKLFTKWLDQLFINKDSHPYRQKRGGKESIDIDEFRTLISDEIPKWVTIHMSIWCNPKLHWDLCDPNWLKLYDSLTRWRLLSQIYKKGLYV
jgi:hypothetical protein